MRLNKRLKAIWAIITAEAFNVSATYPSPDGFTKCSVVMNGRDEKANLVHRLAREYFNIATWEVKNEPEP